MGQDLSGLTIQNSDTLAEIKVFPSVLFLGYHTFTPAAILWADAALQLSDTSAKNLLSLTVFTVDSTDL